jgi:hypothetical protein
MTAQVKTWKTPELRVLVRSRPEEAVLAGCKWGGTLGPADMQMRCKRNNTICSSPAKS